MAIAAALLTQGSSTTDATTYNTASFNATASSLCLFAILHRGASGRLVESIIEVAVGTVQRAQPVAMAILDGYSGGSRVGVLEVWAASGNDVGNNPKQMTMNGTALGCLWGVIELTGVDTTELPHSAIRQVAPDQSQSSTGSTTISVNLANKRAAGNAVVGVFGHFVNEATTPGTGLTELVDQANADIGGLEVSYALTWQKNLSASFATSTAQRAGIALEIAAPSNDTFVADPEAALYP